MLQKRIPYQFFFFYFLTTPQESFEIETSNLVHVLSLMLTTMGR